MGTLGRPQTFATADLDLDVFHRPSQHLADAVPPRTPATAARPPHGAGLVLGKPGRLAGFGGPPRGSGQYQLVQAML
ncbi:hypothetical protein ACIGXI_25885 [Kitasatospora aureofaciens]|uniref:hypothetical protein n=1 Tax=Kitasatospora aureofaciens TaxID=1894 RepID=UPI0037C5CC84